MREAGRPPPAAAAAGQARAAGSEASPVGVSGPSAAVRAGVATWEAIRETMLSIAAVICWCCWCWKAIRSCILASNTNSSRGCQWQGAGLLARQLCARGWGAHCTGSLPELPAASAASACVSARRRCCCCCQGLVKYDADIDEVSILANRVSPRSPLDPESEITYANDLAIAADGRVFFTSCSDISPMRVREGYYDTFGAWMMGLAQVCVLGGGEGVRVWWWWGRRGWGWPDV